MVRFPTYPSGNSQEIENAEILDTPAFFRLGKSPFDVPEVVRTGTLSGDISAIHWEGGDHLFERR